MGHALARVDFWTICPEDRMKRRIWPTTSTVVSDKEPGKRISPAPENEGGVWGLSIVLVDLERGLSKALTAPQKAPSRQKGRPQPDAAMVSTAYIWLILSACLSTRSRSSLVSPAMVDRSFRAQDRTSSWLNLLFRGALSP